MRLDCPPTTGVKASGGRTPGTCPVNQSVTASAWMPAIGPAGRSDEPNQINNVLAFPGVFRGALDAEAADITEAMEVAAAEAIAGRVGDDELRPEYIVPSVFDRGVAPAVAKAVRDASAGGRRAGARA